MSINILYEDNSIIVIEKPAGVATQSADITQRDCVSLVKEHIKKNDPEMRKEPYVGVIHRLDQPVAGLLVFAKTKAAATSLSAQIREDIMNKHYLAMVEGRVDAPEDIELANLMYKDSRLGKAIITDDFYKGEKSVKAELVYHTERVVESADRTILSIRLITGRFHQIRAQMSNMGHPIVGDAKYGARTSYPGGIALVADRLGFIHPDTGEKVEKTVDFSFLL